MTTVGRLLGWALMGLIAFTAFPAFASADGYPDRDRGPYGYYDKPYPPYGYYGRPYGPPDYRGPRRGWSRDFGGSVYFPGGSVRWSPNGGRVRAWGVNVWW